MGTMHEQDSIEAFNVENVNTACVSELREDYYSLREFPQGRTILSCSVLVVYYICCCFNACADLKDTGTNRWPNPDEIGDGDSFRKTMTAYFNFCHDISQVLLICLAQGLAMHPTQFTSCCKKADNVLELKRYNAMTDGNEIDRLSPHKDLSMVSLLLQDRHGGLEILHKQQGWINSKVSNQSLLVNVGDMLEKLSGEKVVSTSHRVRFQRTTEPRHSIVYFSRADWETATDKEDMIGDLMPL